MNDEDRLEAELAAMRPLPLDNAIIHRMHVAALEQRERPTFGDRLLTAWTLAGALAACAILAVTLWQFAATPTPPLNQGPYASPPNVEAEIARLIAAR